MPHTTASVKVKSGHLTASSRAVISVVDSCGDMVVLRIAAGGAEIELEMTIAGAHLAQLVDMLTADEVTGRIRSVA